jgi:transposase
MLHLKNADFIPHAEPVRRFDMFNSPSKRRTFTADEKARIVTESYTSGESVCALARRHGLMPSQVFAWRKNARRHQNDETRAGSGAGQPGCETGVSPSSGPCSATQIEIAVGAIVVRVPPGVDPATLKMVLQVVSAAAA